MDSTLKAIIDFAHGTAYSDLSANTIHEVHRHIIDGVGCAAGAMRASPVVSIRSLVARQRGDRLASVYGLPEPVDVQFAAFANATANRYLDFNDTYVPGPGGHPNDMVPALFSLAESFKVTGKDLVLAVFLAYEIFGTLTRSTPIRDRGWDQGFQCAIGIAAAGSRLLRLSRTRSGSAVSLAVTPNIPLRVVRAGELSHWKGCATAYAGMASIFALRLAEAGITGPTDVFEGTDGVFDQVTGEFDLTLDATGPSVVERTIIKHVPAELSAQVPVQLAQEVRSRVDVEEIASIDVFTHHLGWHETGGGQGDAAAKWDPKTRETADHSLPYIVATVLREGELTRDSFNEDRIGDPQLRPLMRKIAVHEDEEISDRFRTNGEVGARIEATLGGGEVIRVAARQPKGAPEDPMSDSELLSKVEPMIAEVLPTRVGELTDRLWSLEAEPDLDPVGLLFRSFGTAV